MYLKQYFSIKSLVSDQDSLLLYPLISSFSKSKKKILLIFRMIFGGSILLQKIVGCGISLCFLSVRPSAFPSTNTLIVNYISSGPPSQKS